MAISIVGGAPIFRPAGINPTGPVTLDRTVSPLSDMVSGDWFAVDVFVRQNTAPTVLATGGQTWVSETAINTGTAGWARLFHCRFNGTWSANPSFGVAASTQPNLLVGFPLRGVANTNVDGVATSGLDQADGGGAYSAPGSPFDVTRLGQNATIADCLAIAVFSSVDDNTWAVQTAGWTDNGYLASAGGNDASIHAASKVVAAGATGSVVSRQTANGGDAGIAQFFIARPAAVVAVPRSFGGVVG